LKSHADRSSMLENRRRSRRPSRRRDFDAGGEVIPRLRRLGKRALFASGEYAAYRPDPKTMFCIPPLPNCSFELSNLMF
jgi:hypothetical protein